MFNFRITDVEQWKRDNVVIDAEHIAHVLSSDQLLKETLSDFMKKVRNEMGNINLQLNELRNVVMKQQKNDKMDGSKAMNKRMESLKMNMNRLMKDGSGKTLDEHHGEMWTCL